VGITDGDTIRVMHSGKAERIRLNGIDYPERRQAFATRAKEFTSSLAFGKEVTVKVKDKDRYGRTVADVILPDGKSLNHELVKAGYAWGYRKDAPHDRELEWLEKYAREDRRGLWSDPHAIPPWEYRTLRRSR
jgi:micrococcal nuclease